MSLFLTCELDACQERADFKSSGVNPSKNLCEAHLGTFLRTREETSTSIRLTGDLTSTDTEIIQQVGEFLPSITAEMMGLCIELRNQKVEALQNQINQINLTLENQLSGLRRMQRDNTNWIKELLQQKQFPKLTTEGWLPVLAQLKAQDKFSKHEFFQGILTSMTTVSQIDGISEIILCECCSRIGWKRELHLGCTVCSQCIGHLPATGDRSCKACQRKFCWVCKRTMPHMREYGLEQSVCSDCLEFRPVPSQRR